MPVQSVKTQRPLQPDSGVSTLDPVQPAVSAYRRQSAAENVRPSHAWQLADERALRHPLVRSAAVSRKSAEIERIEHRTTRISGAAPCTGDRAA